MSRDANDDYASGRAHVRKRASERRSSGVRCRSAGERIEGMTGCGAWRWWWRRSSRFRARHADHAKKLDDLADATPFLDHA
ncbi:hypothetical protein [Kitasatospora griseola]|uniref:hypothetical protein n=1 Tax=Kitasatospora griseola TaxID=2064 RepID=UPI0038131E3D